MTDFPFNYGREAQSGFEVQYRRLLCATGCRNMAELADFMETSRAQVSDVRRRQELPGRWLIRLLDKTGVNPEWVRSGRKPRLLRPAGEKQAGGAAGAQTVPAAAAQESGAGASAAGAERRLADFSTDELLAELLRRAGSATAGRRRNNLAKTP